MNDISCCSNSSYTNNSETNKTISNIIQTHTVPHCHVPGSALRIFGGGNFPSKKPVKGDVFSREKACTRVVAKRGVFREKNVFFINRVCFFLATCTPFSNKCLVLNFFTSEQSVILFQFIQVLKKNTRLGCTLAMKYTLLGCKFSSHSFRVYIWYQTQSFRVYICHEIHAFRV